MRKSAILILAAGLGAGACTYDSYGPYSYGSYSSAPYGAYYGQAWAGQRTPYLGDLHGPGVEILDPWLLESREGRTVVTMGFRGTGDGFVSEEVANRANIWFRRYADQDRDMKITDPEIRTALVQAAGRYLRQPIV